MKLASKEEAAVKKVYMAYWESYLSGDLETFNEQIDPEFKLIGTSEIETLNSKNEVTQWLKDSVKELNGQADLRNREITCTAINDLALVNELANIYILSNAEWTFYSKIRISTLLRPTPSGWKIVQQHGSFPDTRTGDGETISFETLSKENIELREAVKRRTIELEYKNRELEIETALERVRSRSLAMHKTAELQSVIHTVHQELLKLNLGIHGGSFIAINSEIDKVLRCWGAGGTAETSEEIIIPYYDKPFYTNLLKSIKKQQGFFTEVYTQKEKQAFFTFLFTHEPWSKLTAKEKKETLNSPGGYTRSCCVLKHTSIFIINHFGIPFSDEDNNILQRFAKVFEQTYTRFLDLQKAEAQTREAEIELALERVRARTMAMQRSNELSEAVYILFEQFKELGEKPNQATIGIINEKEGVIEYWVTMYGSPINQVFKFPLDEPNVTAVIYKGWKESKKSLVIDLSGKSLSEFMKYRAAKGGAAVNPEEKQRIINVAFFSRGLLNVQFIEGHSIQSIRLLERFAAVFEQTYTRFLDLQKAEAQAKEAQIEAALEKVRSRSLAMTKSDQLSEVILEIHRKFNELEVSMESRIAIVVVLDCVSKDFNQYIASQDVGNIYISTPYFQHPILDDFYEAKEAGVEFFSKAYSEEEKNSYFKRFFETSFTSAEIAGLEEQAKWVFAQKFYTHSQAFQKNSCIGMADYSGVPLTEYEIDIIKRFSKVFDQAYTRFLDLKKSEEQAREAQIEAALERVRSRTMAMHHTEELREVIQVVFEQLVGLKIHVDHAGFILDYKEREDMHIWLADHQQGVPTEITFPYFDSPHWNSYLEAKARQESFFANLLPFEVKNKFYQDLFGLIPELTEEAKKAIFSKPALAISTVLLDNVGLYIEHYSVTPFTAEENAVLMRFGKVFQQAYTRFLDLQKAEAQAREAQIEAALERIRSKSLAMFKANDLGGVVSVLFEQMQELSVDMSFVSVSIFIFETGSRILTQWILLPDGVTALSVPYFDHPISSDLFDAKDSGTDYFAKAYTLEEKNSWLEAGFVLTDYKNLPEAFKTMLLEAPGYAMSIALGKHAGICIPSFQGTLPKTEDVEIMKRVNKVFEQAYIRFLDLQKAEAQARESQIQLALERVRARTMAMQKSEELAEVSYLLNKQVVELGIPTRGCAFNIYNEQDATEWFSNLEGTIPAYKTPRENIFLKYYEAGQRGENLWIEEFGGERIKEHYKYLATLSVSENEEETIAAGVAEVPEYQIDHVAFFKYGYLLFITLVPAPEAHEVFKRFAKEFEQTYTRFLDLQRAESQAREAQIEAALERVRSQSMGMQTSKDLSKVTSAMFEQLRMLGSELYSTGIVFCDLQKEEVEQWHSVPDAGMLTPFVVPVDLDYIHQYRYDQWKKGTELFSIEIPEDFIGQHFQTMFNLPTVKAVLDDFAAREIPMPETPSWEIDYGASFKYGYILISALKPLQETTILPRFAKVFEQTYTRFLDLQKAERRAREAKIDAALEKVRSRTMAMQSSAELGDVATVLFKELNFLVDDLWSCGFVLCDKDRNEDEWWLTTESGFIPAFHLPNTGDRAHENLYKAWKSGETYHVEQLEGAELELHYNWLMNIPIAKKIFDDMEAGGFKKPTWQQLHGACFSKGYLVIITQVPCHEEEVFKRFAQAFDLTYTRFLDLQYKEEQAVKLKAEKERLELALGELQSAQKQLIQSEKMASLGELTAGIAHEIQNPLNFVNNFSEVSKELIEEVKSERAKVKGERDEALEEELLDDIAQNLEKINHHGKRADAIVKGMLQHSRSSSGQKEPTDINALADEYLRLAYHGLRAKDKSFNATMKTDFDETIGNINIIPQDIGRVLLNLINNAFYAVNDKSTNGEPNYIPTVSITTKQTANSQLQIAIQDNGNGIPQKIMDKIFQPFFTTKPTGQGTGLGLSLSYDIVKAHGGEIEMNTTEGQGTTFTIRLKNI